MSRSDGCRFVTLRFRSSMEPESSEEKRCLSVCSIRTWADASSYSLALYACKSALVIFCIASIDRARLSAKLIIDTFMRTLRSMLSDICEQ